MPLATFGDYQLLHVISTTGSGVTFRARRNGEACVVYIGDPVRVHDATFRERFEARVEAALARSALGVAEVTGAGWRGDLPWVAMAGEGWTLGEIRRTALATETEIEPRLLLDIAISAARALDELHTAPPASIHARLGEDQILIQEDGSSLLLGVGFDAKADLRAWPLPDDLNALASMPPELIEGKPVDARADIYSLCVAIYQSATGDNPFAGEDIADVRQRILAGHLVDPDAIALPHGLGAVFAVGMARNPASRPERAADLATRLERVQRSLGGAPDPMDWTLLLDELFPDGFDGHRTPPDLIGRPPVRRVLQAILSPGAVHTITRRPVAAEPPAPASDPVAVMTEAPPPIPREATPLPVAPRASESLFRTATPLNFRRPDGPPPAPGSGGSLFKKPIGAAPAAALEGAPRVPPPPTSSALGARGAAHRLPEPPPRAPSVRAPPEGPPREWTPVDEADAPPPVPSLPQPITLDDGLVSIVPDPESSQGSQDTGAARVNVNGFTLRDPTPLPPELEAPPIRLVPPASDPPLAGTEPYARAEEPEPAVLTSEPPRFDAVPVPAPVEAPKPPAPPEAPRVPWILLGGLGLLVGVGGGWFLANQPTVTPDPTPSIGAVEPAPAAPATPSTLTRLDIAPDGEKVVIRGILQPAETVAVETITGGQNGRRARHLIRIPAGVSGIGHKRFAIDSPLTSAAVVQRDGDDLTVSVDVAPPAIATASFTAEPGGFTLVIVPSPPTGAPNP